MKYKVFNKITGEDITDNESWVVTPDGRLFFLDYDSLTGDPNAIYIPEVEVIEEKKHGRWIYWDGWCGNHDRRIDDAVCSECGYQHRTVRYENGDWHNFVPVKLSDECPNCGSIMDKY